MRKRRATCPKCGREDTPVKVDGEMACHFPRGGGATCYGNYREIVLKPFFHTDNLQRYTDSLIDQTDEKQERNMSNIDILLRRAEMLDKAIQEEMEKQERFGVFEEMADDTVIAWNQHYGSGNGRSGKLYSFVAIKCAGHWYTSGIYQNERWTTDELIDRHLSKAEDGNIWVVGSWEKV